MLVVSEPVSCSPEGWVQLASHQGTAETTSATQNCHPAGAQFDRQFNSRLPLSGHFTTARNSRFDQMARHDHPLLRAGICAGATLPLPRPLPSSFTQQKQIQACSCCRANQRFSWNFAPWSVPPGCQLWNHQIKKCVYTSKVFLVFTLKPAF